MERLWFLLCCFIMTPFNAHTRCGRGSIFCHLMVVAWFLAFYHVVHPGLVVCLFLTRQYASSSIFVSLLDVLYLHLFGMIFKLFCPWVGCKCMVLFIHPFIYFLKIFLQYWGPRDIAFVGVFQQVRTVCNLEVLTIWLGGH